MSSDERDALLSLVDSVLASLGEPCDDGSVMAAARHQLADVGVWTLGVADEFGGGGADHALSTIAFSRLGRGWGAMGWSCVQAHAAADLLAADGSQSQLLAELHSASIAVAVVDLGISDALAGQSFIRVDVASERPHLILLTGDAAQLYAPDQLEYRALRRTGLDGALTRAVEPRGPGHHLAISGVGAAQVRLRLGASAVAAGIADAAAQAALEYCSTRKQFGSALTALPTVREGLLACRGAAVTTLRQVMAGDDIAPWEAAAILDVACERAIDAAARAVQSHGGYGYLTEYRVERLLRDAVSLRAACNIGALALSGASDLIGTVCELD